MLGELGGRWVGVCVWMDVEDGWVGRWVGGWGGWVGGWLVNG